MSKSEGKNAWRSRRALIGAAALAAGGGPLPQFVLAGSVRAEEKKSKPTLMFVQIAEDLKVDPASQTFRLVKVGQQTLFFADQIFAARSELIAGHVKMADYLAEWTLEAGTGNFGNDPPNATLSVFEPGKSENTLATVSISNPKVDGGDLVYSHVLINGILPAAGGATSLFIDWVRAGRGVGYGFRGAGVGRRRPGVRP